MRAAGSCPDALHGPAHLGHQSLPRPVPVSPVPHPRDTCPPPTGGRTNACPTCPPGIILRWRPGAPRVAGALATGCALAIPPAPTALQPPAAPSHPRSWKRATRCSALRSSHARRRPGRRGGAQQSRGGLEADFPPTRHLLPTPACRRCSVDAAAECGCAGRPQARAGRAHFQLWSRGEECRCLLPTAAPRASTGWCPRYAAAPSSTRGRGVSHCCVGIFLAGAVTPPASGFSEHATRRA